MNKLNNEKKYRASIYLRLSKEDGDKTESDSIKNQRDLILEFLKNKPEIEVVSERIDDGYSGVNFDRPAMKKLIEDAENGVIDCLIVKDLSRFGRNYVDVGKYLDYVFPSNGVRVISINEGFDSIGGKTINDYIVVPLLNFMNDSYLRDISSKVRSQFEVKRIKGDFIGSFAVYGYFKNPENKHKLVVDEYAAGIVKDIFKWKIEGLSGQKIADKLNSLDILSPMEYKKYCGLDYKCSFQKNTKAMWSAVAVSRILKNECYIGTLVQGKRSTPNHKSKKSVYKPESEWIKVENSHEAIIKHEDFALVNRLLLADTRTSPNQNEVYTFSGLLYCADCGNSLVRSSVKQGDKSYFYYMCGKNRTTKECSSHRISDNSLADSVLLALKKHISNTLQMEQLLGFIDTLPIKTNNANKLNANLTEKEQEIKRYERLKTVLFEKLSDGIVDKDEYLRLKEVYDMKQMLCQNAITELLHEREKLMQNFEEETEWIKKFKEHKNIEKLDRKIAVNLIDKIIVYQDRRIEICFKYQYKYNLILDMLKSVNTATLKKKEAV